MIEQHVVVPIVEGQSEVAAIGPFLRRLAHDSSRFDVEIARPLRVKRNQIVKKGELEGRIRLAVSARPKATAILLILDADDDCPVELADGLRTRARSVTDLRVSVVIPEVEIEAWLLAGIGSLQGICGISASAADVESPESVRDAKGTLTACMGGTRGYVATADMPALLQAVDYVSASARSRSLRKLRADFGALIA